MDGFLLAFAVSAGVVFVAELGDKSQLMALAFATRYRALPIIVGITIGTSLVHLLSVAIGYALSSALPTGWIGLVAALAFLGFGAWTLRGDSPGEDEQGKAQRATGSAIVVSAVAFFLSELGDKTMLATITLATQYDWVGVWAGSTLGMVAADALAILVGRKLGRHLPERVIAVGAAVLFFAGGLWLLHDAVDQLTGVSVLAVAGGLLDHHAAGWIALGLGIASTLVVVVSAAAARRVNGTTPRAGRLARGLFLSATVLGLLAPLLVAADVVDPIALFDNPGVVVTGVGLSLLGTALVLMSQVETAGADASLVTDGLHGRIRNPALTGMVLAVAGTLLMVPTLLAVLAAVAVVAAANIHARGLREPRLAEQHGEVYTEYAARTGRFLPRVRSTAPPRDSVLR